MLWRSHTGKCYHGIQGIYSQRKQSMKRMLFLCVYGKYCRVNICPKTIVPLEERKEAENSN